MKKIKFSLITILALVFLNACTSVKEGLAGNKTKTSDEFLVEKKSPLVLPPSYGELPEPKSNSGDITKSSQQNDFNLEESVNKDTPKNKSESNNNINESIESSIIKKINKK